MVPDFAALGLNGAAHGRYSAAPHSCPRNLEVADSFTQGSRPKSKGDTFQLPCRDGRSSYTRMVYPVQPFSICGEMMTESGCPDMARSLIFICLFMLARCHLSAFVCVPSGE